MPKSYQPEFRRKVLVSVDAGCKVVEVAITGDDLVAARKWIVQLEMELAVTRRPNELLEEVVHPKGGSRSSQ